MEGGCFVSLVWMVLLSYLSLKLEKYSYMAKLKRVSLVQYF